MLLTNRSCRCRGIAGEPQSSARRLPILRDVSPTEEGVEDPMRILLFAALVAAAAFPETTFAARSAGFDPRIVTVGPAREQIKSTPITQRPYRPLHVYGNTVRRRHSRGGSGLSQ
jgi:hypothetical protein